MQVFCGWVDKLKLVIIQYFPICLQMVLALLRSVRGVERPPPRPVPSAEAREPHVPAVVDVLLELFVWNAME